MFFVNDKQADLCVEPVKMIKQTPQRRSKMMILRVKSNNLVILKYGINKNSNFKTILEP